MRASALDGFWKFAKAVRRMRRSGLSHVGLLLALLVIFAGPSMVAAGGGDAFSPRQSAATTAGSSDEASATTAAHCNHKGVHSGQTDDDNGRCHGDCCPCCDLDDLAAAIPQPDLWPTLSPLLLLRKLAAREDPERRPTRAAFDGSPRGPPQLI